MDLLSVLFKSMLSLLFEFAGGLTLLACPTTDITSAAAPR